MRLYFHINKPLIDKIIAIYLYIQSTHRINWLLSKCRCMFVVVLSEFPMAVFSIRRFITPLIHILVWGLLGFILLLFIPLTWQTVLPPQFWVKQGALFCLLVGAFYLNAWVWVPRLLFQNRTGWFMVVVIATAAAVVLLSQLTDAWLNLPELMRQAFQPAKNGAPRHVRVNWDIFVTWVTLLVLGISTSVAAVQKWQKDAQIRQSLEQQKISSELSFLRAQINPHFFFNTLNNIYVLTTIDVESARQALHNLSRMMRYVLYETQKDTVLLSQEITFIQDYIELMKLRLTDKVGVVFEQPVPLKDVLIAPMLFLPFVENAFKHGVSTQVSSGIYIGISQQGNLLQMKVSNRIFSEKGMVLDESSGIGLANTRRRLDLLYPSHHKLSIKENTVRNEYVVHLTLDLS